MSPFIPLFFVLFTLSLVLGTFFFLFRAKKRQLPIELESKPILTLTCAGTIGALNFRGPFVRLSLYHDFLVISYWKQLLLRPEDIINIEISRVLFVQRVIFHHRNSSIPKQIRLTFRDIDRFRTALSSLPWAASYQIIK